MNEIVIYGASDDLIEIKSTAFGNEEFSIWFERDSDSRIIAVSDGTVLRVRHDEDGVWRFTPVMVGSATLDVKLGVDDRRHSDIIILTGDNLNWVVLGTQIAK